MTLPLPVGTLDPNVLALSRFTRESRTGSTSATWDLVNRILEGYELVFKNGILLQGGGVDYSVSGARITFVAAPIAGDRTTAVYYYPARL
jgi:hypothetical protein